MVWRKIIIIFCEQWEIQAMNRLILWEIHINDNDSFGPHLSFRIEKIQTPNESMASYKWSADLLAHVSIIQYRIDIISLCTPDWVIIYPIDWDAIHAILFWNHKLSFTNANRCKNIRLGARKQLACEERNAIEHRQQHTKENGISSMNCACRIPMPIWEYKNVEWTSLSKIAHTLHLPIEN